MHSPDNLPTLLYIYFPFSPSSQVSGMISLLCLKMILPLIENLALVSGK